MELNCYNIYLLYSNVFHFYIQLPVQDESSGIREVRVLGMLLRLARDAQFFEILREIKR